MKSAILGVMACVALGISSAGWAQDLKATQKLTDTQIGFDPGGLVARAGATDGVDTPFALYGMPISFLLGRSPRRRLGHLEPPTRGTCCRSSSAGACARLSPFSSSYTP